LQDSSAHGGLLSSCRCTVKSRCQMFLGVSGGYIYAPTEFGAVKEGVFWAYGY